jgi:hypothetical protein
MTSTDWHVPDHDLRTYAVGRAAPPQRWSVEAHLSACPACRARLTAVVAPSDIDSGWDLIDAELDAPVPGRIERLIARCGVPEQVARLLAATPALRVSWLAALGSTVTLMAVLANVAKPVVFLAMAPLLPVLGVAVSFGPRVDPTFEITLVAPIDTFRLLLLRCAAVLGVTTTMSAVASFAMPDYGLKALGWFLPGLALTLISLALAPRLDPVRAAVVVGVGWILLVLSTLRAVVFSPTGQAAVAVAAVLAGAAVVLLRPAFDTSRTIDRAPGAGAGRMS